jgi:subtilisin family serine protease
MRFILWVGILFSQVGGFQALARDLIIGFSKETRLSVEELESIPLKALNATSIRHYAHALRGINILSFKDYQDAARAKTLLLKHPLVLYAEFNQVLPLSDQSRPQYMCSLEGRPRKSCDMFEELVPFHIKVHKPEPSKRDYYSGPPSPDPLLKDQWALEKVGIQDAWRYSKGSRSIIIANVDSGVRYNHEDLHDNHWRSHEHQIGWDFLEDAPFPHDDNGHGTRTAGIIGATGENGIGISGVCQRAAIMSLRFVNRFGHGYTTTAIRAFEYAAKHGARIINSSWYDPFSAPDPLDTKYQETNLAFQDAITRLTSEDILVIFAAGNQGESNDAPHAFAPARFHIPGLVTVVATNQRDELTTFSNYADNIHHLGAPGENILSTSKGNDYSEEDGTSMAAPLVSGILGLMMSYRPEVSAFEHLHLLMESAERVPGLWGKSSLGRRVHAGRALRALDQFRRNRP